MPAKDQYQVPEGVERFTPVFQRGPNEEANMRSDAEGGYFRVSDLAAIRASWEKELIAKTPGKVRRWQYFLGGEMQESEDGQYFMVIDLPLLHQQWEAEQREEVGTGKWAPVTVYLDDGELRLESPTRLLSSFDGPAEQFWPASVARFQGESAEHWHGSAAFWQDRAEKAEKALAKATDLADEAANLGVKRTVERDEAKAALAEAEERFESCDNCQRTVPKDDLETIWCREPESGEQVDARICLACRLKAALAEQQKALSDCIDLAEEGWAYASDYFREKWEFDKEIAKARAALQAAQEVGE